MTDLQDPAAMLAGAWPGQRMGHALRPNVLGDWRIPRIPEAVPEARHHIGELAKRILAYSSHLDDAKLMASELVTNAVEHGAGESVWIRVTANKRTVRVEVRDQGTDFKQPSVSDSPPPEREYGRGLFLVETFASLWGVDHDPNGTTVWFEVQSS